MENNKSIEDVLAVILEEHSVSCARLLEIIRQERQHIIHGRVDELEHVIEEKAGLQEDIAELETRRLSLVKEFARKYRIDTTEPHLEDIIAVVDESYGTHYKLLQKRLRKVFKQIELMHEGNRILIARSISFQERSFMLLFGVTKDRVRYEKDGQVTHSNKPLIDSTM